MEESAEQRRQKRFRVKQGAFAGLGHQFRPVGQVTDISSGGLSFRYVASRERTNTSSILKIALTTDSSFHFDNVPVKPVWDLAIPSAFSSGSITMRQCGVQFQEMTPDQKFDLGYFIQNHTADEVEQ
jgi:hypothetical protein